MSPYFQRGKLCLPPAFALLSCFVYSRTLKMEAICSSEMSLVLQRTTRRYIPEDRILLNQRCENLKSYISFVFIAYSLTIPTFARGRATEENLEGTQDRQCAWKLRTDSQRADNRCRCQAGVVTAIWRRPLFYTLRKVCYIESAIPTHQYIV
jgi:hypothetical protein